MPLNHQTLKNTKPSHYGQHTLQGRLHFTPLIQQNKARGVNTPSDLDLPFFYLLLLVYRLASCVECVRAVGGSLHCVCTADFARTRARSISVMGTLAQCITLITLASHFSCMKPSPELTATGCTLGQLLLHHHNQQRAMKVLT